MKNSKKVIGTILALTTIFMFSCKKYDNGGTLAKAEKNIAQTWKIESYLMDGSDQTAALLITNFTETFADDGSYTRNFNDASGDLKNESGSWTLDNDKSLINVSGTGSFELTEETSTVSASDYTILKLDKDELWYNFSNGGATHEFHMIPQ